jgi:hypothetical protein
MAGVIYVLVGTKKNGEEEIFYVGRADDASSRFKQHLRDCANPDNPKAAYEHARHAYSGVFRLEVIAKEDASNTEEFWRRQLILDGHTLYNATGGNSVVPKKRSMSPIAKAFREVNARAEREERHTSSAQVLTRPQVLAQRVLNGVPTAGELHQQVWIDQPPECMGEKYMKGTKRVEYLKFGDFSIYIGWKAGESKCNVRCFNRHKHTELGFSFELMTSTSNRLRVLDTLVKLWPDPASWQSKGD